MFGLTRGPKTPAPATVLSVGVGALLDRLGDAGGVDATQTDRVREGRDLTGAPLQDANLVRFDKRGTRHVFEIDGEGLQAARRWLDAFWDDALARFALVAENTAAARDGDDP